jgi:uncharacterized protein (DUF885 family)
MTIVIVVVFVRLHACVDLSVQAVPMDYDTALEDARMYLATPGLGLSYGIGKSQIVRFVAMAREQQEMSEAGSFELGELHDYIWLNGNGATQFQGSVETA